MQKRTTDIKDIAKLILSPEVWDRESLINETCQNYFATNARADRNVARFILRASLLDPDVSVRNLAAEYMEEVGTQDDLFALKQCRFDPESIVRMSTYSALGAICGTRHAHLIIHGFTDTDPIVRRYAYVGLSTLLGSKSTPILMEWLARESDDLARVGLISALCSAGEIQFVDELERFAMSDWPRISSPARAGIEELINFFESKT